MNLICLSFSSLSANGSCLERRWSLNGKGHWSKASGQRDLRGANENVTIQEGSFCLILYKKG